MNVVEISLCDLKFHAFHGVMPQEKVVGNEFSVNLSVRTEYSDRILDDDISATVSYADLYTIIDNEMQRPRKLLETLAAAIVLEIQQRFPQIKGGEIMICKSTPPISGCTGNARVKIFF